MKRTRKSISKNAEPEVIAGEEAEKRPKLTEQVTSKEASQDPSDTPQLHRSSADTIENAPGTACPYLDTVNRAVLDFDFERKCSVSLSTTNVYCCLVCGKYFQGRTFNTHAGKHSVEEDHHVFVNMHNRKIYCLPEDYEIFDSSLADIQHNVNPTVLPSDVLLLDTKESISRTLDNRQAIQGVLAMNTPNSGDSATAILQCLLHLPKFRDYLLEESFYHDDRPASELLVQMSTLTKRIWNSTPWRQSVSPHEVFHEISIRSDGKFGVGAKSDPIEFYSWIVNTLHRDLALDAKRRGVKKASVTPISDLFQGQVTIQTEKLTRKKQELARVEMNTMDIDTSSLSGDQPVSAATAVGMGAEEMNKDATTTKVTPFFHLQFELPTVTLLKDEKSKTASLQVPIYTLLSKFDGHSKQFLATTRENRTCKIQTLPDYLVLFVKRFTQNLYLVEKNKTIVNFPTDELDLTEYTAETKNTKYNLSSYICHTGDSPSGSCLARYFHKANGKWYNTQDGAVDELQAELHFVAEAYILFYERCK